MVTTSGCFGVVIARGSSLEDISSILADPAVTWIGLAVRVHCRRLRHLRDPKRIPTPAASLFYGVATARCSSIFVIPEAYRLPVQAALSRIVRFQSFRFFAFFPFNWCDLPVKLYARAVFDFESSCPSTSISSSKHDSSGVGLRDCIWVGLLPGGLCP